MLAVALVVTLPSTVNPAGEDELPGGAQELPTGSGSPAPAPSRGPNPAPGKYTDEDLQRITKLCMESFIQGQGQTKAHPERRERPLKARFPDLYYGKSHMDCYHFCQQCEDHFDTARATGSNRTSFAASFLHGSISFRWTQYKRRHEGEGVSMMMICDLVDIELA